MAPLLINGLKKVSAHGNSTTFMNQLIYILAFVFLTSCSSPKENEVKAPAEKPTKAIPSNQQKEQAPSMPSVESLKLDYQVVRLDSGYGYHIIAGEKPMIQQHHIPGVQGMHYFTTYEQAEKVAKLVIYKLKNNIMPPSVTVLELDSLNIAY